MVIALDKRLQTAFGLVKNCTCVVDVGCDHGKMAVKLAVEKIANRVIAIDISRDSLAKAKKLSIINQVENVVDCRMGDGVSMLDENEHDTVIIAGMGGLEIMQILNNRKRNFCNYILIPHRNARDLREYLARESICPYYDQIVECDNKFYHIIGAVHGEYAPNDSQLELGNVYDTLDFAKFAHQNITKLEAIIDRLPPGERQEKERILMILRSKYAG